MGRSGRVVSTTVVNVRSRESVHALVSAATSSGDVTGLIHTAGISPSQAPPELILQKVVGQRPARRRDSGIVAGYQVLATVRCAIHPAEVLTNSMRN